MKILAIDPGSKRIGLAISDVTGSIANPLLVINHTNRHDDAIQVARLVETNEVKRIVVGQSLDENGVPTFEGRRSQRFVDELRIHTNIPVILWDESLTTNDAREARLMMGVKRKDRSGHLDSLAAVVLLQSYLDSIHAS